MKTNPVVAIQMAALILAAVGCHNDEGMGTDLLPASDHASIVIDTIEVKAYTELEKPVKSANMTYMLVGKFEDPVFGVTETSFASKFSNSSYGKYASANDVCDSVILTMGVDKSSTFFYGDSIADVTVDVFRLTEPIVDTVDYYNNHNMDGKYDPVRIATTTFKPKDIDSMITFKFDTINEQSLRDFGNLVIKSSLDTTFDKNICGLYFKATAGNSIVKFYRSSKNTQYLVYHHVKDKDTESSSVTYSIQSTDGNFNLSSHDYSNTPLAAVADKASGAQSDYLYLQAMTGTRIRIDIIGIQKIKRGKYFSLRGAYLVAPLADSTLSQQKDYPAIDYVVCAGIDKASERDTVFSEFSLNMSGTTSVNILSRDAANNCYRLNMTGRVADLLELSDMGIEPAYDLYLYPNARTTDFNRSVICSPVNKQTPMKLIVEYANYDM
jgi:hypothetical protein